MTNPIRYWILKQHIKMKLYTKTGDKGQTGLIGGTRVPKNDIRIEAYGTVDELNSFIGALTTFHIPDVDRDFLRSIQNNLFIIGSYLATDTSKVALQKASILKMDVIDAIEKEIDRLDAMLPALNSFILPGGSQTGAFSHICRTISRRVERRLLDVGNVYFIDNEVFVYINRLSDYFFALARYLTVEKGEEEIYWKKQD
ncbi:ATP:cob(I)alamin adenosyltransferase [Paludibacter propionicigenes WB4]|uniref:Corrinoid adenosyltransferase n=1 Tax=Paludibacter propionicigenes (strain DSM 17365 / JCM 13257 / WB4) TaxID=694427 RepID=E4T7D8_PALPW|nr:cob(I)yrinic acid a,c-diamide adenosyltransferase [Paludibacter propionicigenes]ADQ80632.1 ATP:cob(I)alamin adenosyltransferase [Paludibacter propionicigenes WB4]